MKLKLLDEEKVRKARNLTKILQFKINSRVRAISRQDDEWHEGIILSVEGRVVWVRFFKENNNLNNNNN